MVLDKFLYTILMTSSQKMQNNEPGDTVVGFLVEHSSPLQHLRKKVESPQYYNSYSS